MTANLQNDPERVITGNDSIVIGNIFETVVGGKTLDVSGYAPTQINAGHVLLQDASGNYKPWPVNAGATAYAAKPANTTIAGIMIHSVLTKRPFAGILIRGTVNYAAAPFDMTTILADVKAALPLITFRKD